MPELNIYDTMILLFGEPSSFGGVILLYTMSILVTMIIGAWGLIFTLIIVRRLMR